MAVLWPVGYTARQPLTGPIEIIDADGKVAARVGDTIGTGGGYRTADPQPPCVDHDSWVINSDVMVIASPYNETSPSRAVSGLDAFIRDTSWQAFTLGDPTCTALRPVGRVKITARFVGSRLILGDGLNSTAATWRLTGDSLVVTGVRTTDVGYAGATSQQLRAIRALRAILLPEVGEPATHIVIAEGQLWTSGPAGCIVWTPAP